MQNLHSPKRAKRQKTSTKQHLPKVSVVVPVYNAEKYLASCLNSVLTQNYRNLEIIVIDDGSTDTSPDIINKLSQNDDRILVIHKKNGGVSSARNRGIDAAKGEYITFIDADDIIHSRFISSLAGDLILSKADIATTSKLHFKGDTTMFLSGVHQSNAIYQEYSPAQALLELHGGTLERGENGVQMFRCSLIKKHDLYYSEKMAICEDFDFLARAILCSNKVVVDDREMYYYRANPESALHTMSAIQHIEAMNNKQAASRKAANSSPGLMSLLNKNLLLDSISCGALIYDAREDHVVEYGQIVETLNNYKYKYFLAKGLRVKDRVKVSFVVIFGTRGGLLMINRILKKGL